MSSVEVVDHQTLSGYLAGVERAIKQALPEPEWLVAELSSFTVTGKGAVFWICLSRQMDARSPRPRG